MKFLTIFACWSFIAAVIWIAIWCIATAIDKTTEEPHVF